jgi:2-polyprenyl-3-methyl-5-hydroxy-6-metoxy-1,4-benzoquinol methylase
MNLRKLQQLIAQRQRRESLYCTAQYWDGKAKEFNGYAVSMWPNNHLNRLYEAEQLEMLHTTLSSLSGVRALDAGCGIGRLSRWLAAQGAQVTGIDFSEETLAIARRQSPGDNPIYRQQSLFELAEEEAYDVVLCWGVLTVACRTRDELTEVLRRLRMALKPDGRMLLLEPIHRGPLHRVLNMSFAEFVAVMDEVGLVVQETRRLHFWPMRLALAFLRWPRLVVVPSYYLGQSLMRLPGLRHWGDYTAVVAVRDR